LACSGPVRDAFSICRSIGSSPSTAARSSTAGSSANVPVASPGARASPCSTRRSPPLRGAHPFGRPESRPSCWQGAETLASGDAPTRLRGEGWERGS
jgi:hypothetical protein